MNWTTERPTKEGMYWIFDGKEIDLISVWVGLRGMFTCQLGNEDSYELKRFIEVFSITHWMGPIPDPEPPDD